MIIEDQLDRDAPRISGIEKSEEFDELAAAVAISNQSMDLAGEQIYPGQQAERAMAFVLVIPRKGGVDAGFGRQIPRRRCDAMAMPGFSSQDTIATPRLFALAGAGARHVQHYRAAEAVTNGADPLGIDRGLLDKLVPRCVEARLHHRRILHQSRRPPLIKKTRYVSVPLSEPPVSQERN